MKVSATTCLDGKRHKWVGEMAHHCVANTHIEYQLKWCRVCGTTAEFVKEWGKHGWQRCKNADGSIQANIPECHKTDSELAREMAETRRQRQMQYAECVEIPCDCAV